MSNAHYERQWQPTPVLAAQAYMAAHPDIADDSAISLSRKTSSITGEKLWSVMSDAEGVNCKLSDIANAPDWWEEDWDQDSPTNAR